MGEKEFGVYLKSSIYYVYLYNVHLNRFMFRRVTNICQAIWFDVIEIKDSEYIGQLDFLISENYSFK